MSFWDFLKSKSDKKRLVVEKEQFRDTFILALVHKLRTPLNGARWALDSVINRQETGENKEIINEGYNKIISAINTVNEILKIAEINSEDGVFELKKEKLNLCVIISDILKNLDFLVKKNDVTLEYDYKCDPITVYGDKEVLEIGLTNLFDNAIRYSPKGKVIVTVNKENDVTRLVLKDNGIGINKEDFGHLFEKFFRGKNAKQTDSNESGIGLYITKKIIEMHQGKILIDSKENEGTTVEVSLPVD